MFKKILIGLVAAVGLSSAANADVKIVIEPFGHHYHDYGSCYSTIEVDVHGNIRTTWRTTYCYAREDGHYYESSRDVIRNEYIHYDYRPYYEQRPYYEHRHHRR